MELTLNEALKKGIEAHKAGQIQEADRFYTAILKSQPKHPDANHNMGVLAVSVGKVQQALPFFKTALEANPSIGQFWLSYIDALIKVDRIADAKNVFNQIKERGAKGEAFDQLEQSLVELKVDEKSVNLDIDGSKPPEPNILDTTKLDQALRLAKRKIKEGALEEAKSIYQDILRRFPKNKRAVEGLKAAAGNRTRSAAKSQDPPTNQLQPIINLYSHGQLTEALAQATQMLEEFPNSVTLYNVLGAANAGLMQFEAAIDSYKQALKIRPDYAEAYFNMGNALRNKGDPEAAADSYKQALKIKPDYAEAYNNMGNALQDKGDPEAAIDSYKRALKFKPDYAEAYNNMGNALQDKGDPEAAIDSYKRALKIKPDCADEAYNNIGVALKGAVFAKPNPGLQRTINSLLDHKNYVRPKDISKAAISLLKFDPIVQRVFETHSEGKLEKSLHEIISNLSEIPLLIKLMSVCPLPDLELEELLADIRSALLLSISEISSSSEISNFQSALALQCFTNEYVYNQTATEAEALQALEASVEEIFSQGKQPSPTAVLCLASYKALNVYHWCHLLTFPTELEKVAKWQILEPESENRLKSQMPVLRDITDNISSEVREQYEENPYPRWINLGLRLNPAPIPEIARELDLKLFDNKINEIGGPEILVAGCGTGQHSIGTASRFKNSKVLAVDLSLASLAYAKRKTEELGIHNIQYMQADILDLGKLGRQFDVVESAGVLHHMDDPMAGWRVLTGCLKQGGLMRIGLYSELARQDVVKMRDEINQTGIGSNDFAIRSFRNHVVKSDQRHHEEIRSSHDFYSLSTLRDLLFHVQEHRFTLPQIQNCLAELGLKFCGFEADKILQSFKLTNTGSDDRYDLDQWNSYEEDNPDTFGGMYQFWCQKMA